MNLKRLEQRVMKDEGFRAKAYIDTVGVWTVGYGSTSLFGRPVKEGDSVTPEQARIMLRADLFESMIIADELFSTLRSMNDVRQEVLVNMAYNLGPGRLSQFKNLRAAADLLNYPRMAQEMVDSKWYTQVGGRGQRLVAAMKTGEWLET